MFGSMNSINNKSITKTLDSYLPSYKHIFYERIFKNFTMIIIAMLSIGKSAQLNFSTKILLMNLTCTSPL